MLKWFKIPELNTPNAYRTFIAVNVPLDHSKRRCIEYQMKYAVVHTYIIMYKFVSLYNISNTYTIVRVWGIHELQDFIN